jgi:hypothetical protein
MEPTTITKSPEYKRQRVQQAHALFKENAALQRRIIEFMQEDAEIKAHGWNNSTIAYLQSVLTEHAVETLEQAGQTINGK